MNESVEVFQVEILSKFSRWLYSVQSFANKTEYANELQSLCSFLWSDRSTKHTLCLGSRERFLNEEYYTLCLVIIFVERSDHCVFEVFNLKKWAASLTVFTVCHLLID